jgi:hypothetical protein
VLGLAAVLVGVTAAPAMPAGAQNECVRRDDRGECVVSLPVVVPGTPGAPEGPGGPSRPGGRPSGPVSPCRWVTVPDPPESSKAAYPDAPPDAVWQVYSCGALQGENSGMGFRWVAPGGEPAEPTPPSPDVVATLVYATVEAQMAAPTLASDPPPGVAAVVNTPVFVEVTNWQGDIVAGPTCVLGVCVTMTATPTLAFDPGDGSPVIACAPPGSRYVAGGAPMDEQAAGGCAHTYRLRTGAQDRPAEWPGLVTVTWQVSWTSNVGVRGSFAPLTLSAPLPRAVDEVSAVVVDGAS